MTLTTAITFFLAAIATIAVAVIARVLGEDAKTFIPRVSKRLIEHAARKLRPEVRENHC